MSTAFFAFTFLPLHAILGPGVVSLSVVPVAIAGWLFGLRAGMLMGAMAFPFNPVLLGVEEVAELNAVIWGGAVADSASLPVGTVAGTLRDVAGKLQTELAEKRGAEAGLKESGELLRHLVENAPGMLVAVASDGRILYANRSIVGIDSILLRGTNVYAFVPKSHQDLFKRALEGVLTHNEPGGYEIADAPGWERSHAAYHPVRPCYERSQDGRGYALELGRN